MAWELVHGAVTFGNSPTDVNILRELKLRGEVDHPFFKIELELTRDVI